MPLNQERHSFWGWGLARRFPGTEERARLGRMVGALLGKVSLTPREPPSLDSLALPQPRQRVPAALADFSSGTPAARASHTYGKAYRDLVRGFAGDFAAAPDFVARPRDEAEILAVLEWCAERDVACIPFGGGTSVVGGVEGTGLEDFSGVVCLDMRAMDQVVEVDTRSRAARIQAGATGPAISASLAPHGLGLRHYPQSFEMSTLGGWIATRAGGHYATLYTHIDDLVESVHMITPRGHWRSRRLPGSGAGPSPDRMLLGSEGILGVITEAWMKVQPRPRFRASASAEFRDFDRAVEATREIAQSGLHPSNCRLLDAREAMVHRVTASGACVLLLGFESADHDLEHAMERALEIARAHGATIADRRRSQESPDAPTGLETQDADATRPSGAAASWRRAFFDAPYRFNELVSLGVVVDTFETACVWRDFPTMHRAIITDVRDAMKRTVGRGIITCRFTHVYPDGPAPYYTFLAPGCGPDTDPAESRPADWLAVWTEIKAAASEAILRHGGTITHHHAVGRVHRPWYDRQRPAPFAAALAAVKRELDPAGILNPGVLIDPRRHEP